MSYNIFHHVKNILILFLFCEKIFPKNEKIFLKTCCCAAVRGPAPVLAVRGPGDAAHARGLDVSPQRDLPVQLRSADHSNNFGSFCISEPV